ncbi:hypothetical protein GKODMF_08365 [Candidatus Electrothrix gigas]
MPVNSDKFFMWKYLFLICSIISIIAGIFVTPDLLISLGPMRQTLTSSVDSIRSLAHLELSIYRGSCLIISIAFLMLSLKGKEIWNATWLSPIHKHNLRETDRHLGIMTGWNFSLTTIFCCYIGVIIYMTVISRFLSDPLLKIINNEDGIIEYLSAAIFLICSISSCILSFKLSGQTSRIFMLRLFAVVFFLMFGEEISWGQRIFEVKTLEVMKKINVQGENNIHNLLGYVSDHLFIAGFFVYGVIFPVLANRILFLRKFFDFIGLPIASLGLAVGCFMISSTHDWTFYLVFEKVKYLQMAEMRELLSSVAFLLLICESWLLIEKK